MERGHLAEGLNVGNFSGQDVIAGDGPEAPLVKALADEVGPDRFAWLGWREDVTPVLNLCDLLIQTSRNEGTPVSLIQGMAAGRPFISTPAGGVVLVHYGVPQGRIKALFPCGSALLQQASAIPARP